VDPWECWQWLLVRKKLKDYILKYLLEDSITEIVLSCEGDQPFCLSQGSTSFQRELVLSEMGSVKLRNEQQAGQALLGFIYFFSQHLSIQKLSKRKSLLTWDPFLRLCHTHYFYIVFPNFMLSETDSSI
jgi:hypothetical protein